MKKKLPVVTSQTGKKKLPAEEQAAKSLAVAPVKAGSVPEFPRRGELKKGAGKSAALLGGAMLVASGGAALAKDAGSKAVNPGSIDGNPLPKKAPKIKMHREGGGIGPSMMVWEPEDVEAFLNWKFAHDGHLDIKTAYEMDLGDGMKVTLDGFDPNAMIGYEFVYGDDDEQFNDKAVAKLADMMKAKKAAVLVINMTGTPDESTLSKKVSKFFAAVKKNPPAGTQAVEKPTPQPVEEMHPSPKAC
jgi:hypothetical protein